MHFVLGPVWVNHYRMERAASPAMSAMLRNGSKLGAVAVTRLTFVSSQHLSKRDKVPSVSVGFVFSEIQLSG